MRRTRAFTVTELLVVVAIIGLLASLLLPALTKANARARQAVCVSGLRQIGLGLHAFGNDHDGRLPIQISTNQGGSREFGSEGTDASKALSISYHHFQPLSNEVRLAKLLICPSDTRKAAADFASLSTENVSYWMYAGGQVGNSISMMVGDRNVTKKAGHTNDNELFWTAALHKYRGNVLFGDGHIEQPRTIIAVPVTVSLASSTGGSTSGSKPTPRNRANRAPVSGSDPISPAPAPTGSAIQGQPVPPTTQGTGALPSSGSGSAALNGAATQGIGTPGKLPRQPYDAPEAAVPPRPGLVGQNVRSAPNPASAPHPSAGNPPFGDGPVVQPPTSRVPPVLAEIAEPESEAPYVKVNRQIGRFSLLLFLLALLIALLVLLYYALRERNSSQQTSGAAHNAAAPQTQV